MDTRFWISVQKLCGKKNITPTALVKELGLSTSMVTRWKQGYEPTDRTLKKIAGYFDVTTDYLRGYDISLIEGVTPVANNIIEFEEIGVISAGYDGEAIEQPTGRTISVAAENLPRKKKKDDFFVLRIKGNSMYPLLMENDSILVQRCSSVDSGSLAVVLYNGNEATVKKVNYVSGEDWLELVPTNPEYPTKRIEGADLQECRVLGKVIKLIMREL